jgi:uncharacterized membrane protein YdbT with pleckstrin-like domain
MKEEYTFNGQKPGEKVIEVIPSHPYVLYPPGFKTILLICLEVAIVLFFQRFWDIALVLFIVTVVYLIRAIYIYKETLFLVTNLRIFSIVQKGFFKRKITEVEIDKIVDMSSDTQGFSKTFLKYGDLIIRTAGSRADGDIVIKNIAHPYSVQQRVASVLHRLE